MIGSQIREVREKLGLKQAEFASILGVHAVTVSRWESDQLLPTAYQLGLIHKFAEAARRQEAKNEIATIIVTAGAIAGLFFLLKLALDASQPSSIPPVNTRPRGRRRTINT